ncbi:MAG TPA: pyrroline-5-carboxylate reductase [Woeseiaceae bacterium]|nr:pyrroline-5-carboxylate reductase [Woeseiaceae bacterium]
MITRNIGFIGGGNMARAIAGGLLRGGMHATRLGIAEPVPAQCERLRRELFGARVSDDNAAIARDAEILLFAVKPQILKRVCRELAAVVQQRKPLIVSIAAGPRSDDIDSWLGGGLSVVRVMPNQPALNDQGVSAMFANPRCEAVQRDLAEKIMSAVGHVVWLDDEDLMDGVTAVSGTGPAYVYLLIDMMIEAAVSFGIEPSTARALAVETARGAASLALAEDESMPALIDRVRSPGGTTMAAFELLDASDVRAIFAKAIDAARERAAELADLANKDDQHPDSNS